MGVLTGNHKDFPVKIGQVTNKTGHFIQKQRQELGFSHQPKMEIYTRQQPARVVGEADGWGWNQQLVGVFFFRNLGQLMNEEEVYNRIIGINRRFFSRNLGFKHL